MPLKSIVQTLRTTIHQQPESLINYSHEWKRKQSLAQPLKISRLCLLFGFIASQIVKLKNNEETNKNKLSFDDELQIVGNGVNKCSGRSSGNQNANRL